MSGMTTRFQTEDEVIHEMFARAQALPLDSTSRKILERELEERYGVVTTAQAKANSDLKAALQATAVGEADLAPRDEPLEARESRARRRAAAKHARRGEYAKAAQMAASADILNKQ